MGVLSTLRNVFTAHSSNAMFLFVGLGNPGKQYERTRHNCGALFVEFFRIKAGIPALTFHAKTDTRMNKNANLILAIPEMFMNVSGKGVSSLQRYYNIPPERLLVIHDDKDLALGTYKLQHNRSAAGHNGVQSVIESVGTQAFYRLRIGVGPVPDHIPTDRFVLGRFSDDEWDTLQNQVFPNAEQEIRQHYLAGGIR